jgi:hypothetical protein
LEAIGHVLRSALDTNVESVSVQIDFKNTFNSVCRAALIRSVAQHYPQLLPLVCWLYGQHSNLWVEGAPPDTPPIVSRKGVRQGGPLGPLLFGIVLQSVLESTNATHEDSHVLALHDDICLVGSAPDVRLADSELTRAAAAIGLSKAPRKCGVFGHTPSTALETAQLLGMPHLEEGVLVAGCPIGTPAYGTSVSQCHVAKMRVLLNALRHLPLGHQDQFLLLRKSLVPSLVHMTRTGPVNPEGGDADTAVETASADILQAARDIAAVDLTTSLSAEAQLHLPLRHGGCGLRVPGVHSMEGQVEHLASAALAQRAMSSGPALLRQFDGPHRTALETTWQQAMAAAPDSNTAASAQSTFAVHQAQAAYDHLLQGSTADGQIAQARLRSVASPCASAWLEALPAARSLTLSDSEFRAALCRRLGLPTLPRGAPTVTCFCGKALAATDSEHAHTCPTPNALRVLGHDKLVEVVRAMCRGGDTSSKEPLLAALQPGTRIRLPRAEAREDILYVLTNELQVGDVSVVHPGTARYRRAAAATAQRDAEKRARYRQDEWGAYRFTPLSVETFGRLGTPMMRLLSDIGNLAVSSGDGLFTNEQFVSGVLPELSVSLCKTNARLEHGVSSLFVRASGVCIRHGRSRPTAEVSDWDKCVVLSLLVVISDGDVALSDFCFSCFLYLLVIMRLLVIPVLILWLWLPCSSCCCASCALCCNHTHTHPHTGHPAARQCHGRWQAPTPRRLP